MTIKTAEPGELAVATRMILSIDDDPNVSMILNSLLKNRGYEVVSALDGKEGLAKAIELKPKFITLDISMPGMDGWLVLKQLKRLEEVKNIPVIILSVFDEKRMGYDLGAFDYLVKPFELEDIFCMVDRVEENLYRQGKREDL
jgi:DNA-binding response OmpR family regulator